ncbi:MAG: transcription elongation factor Spt5 [Candidatus Micrarchaeota archaeon]|nr:transcription elongation factor Spt5 [Candidatus Micrarchaeota archaeon]
MIYPVKISARDAKIIPKLVEANIKRKGIKTIKAIYVDSRITGYMFIEGDDVDDIKAALSGVRGVNLNPLGYGKVELKALSEEEIEKLFKRREELKQEIKVGDIVEIIRGPFKGEKAKVTAKDEQKGTYTVLPLEAPVAIPITIQEKSIKLIKTSE